MYLTWTIFFGKIKIKITATTKAKTAVPGEKKLFNIIPIKNKPMTILIKTNTAIGP